MHAVTMHKSNTSRPILLLGLFDYDRYTQLLWFESTIDLSKKIVKFFSPELVNTLT